MKPKFNPEKTHPDAGFQAGHQRRLKKQHNPPGRYQVLLRLGVVEAGTQREALAKGLEMALYHEEGAWHGQPTTTADLIILPAATKLKP